jgi:transcription antitermination factor NusG
LVPGTENKKWHALYVSSRAEKKVVARLTDLGIESYLPLKTEKKQWSDRKKTVISPLINGYVFVKINPRQRDQVFQANGVVQYVKYNGKDAIIREAEINILRSIEEKGYYAEAKPLEKLSPGDRTIIQHGPFKGITGIVEHAKGKDLYTLSLESIGYSVKVNLPAEILKSVK